MTVAEVIADLKTMPQNVQVMVVEDGEISPVLGVFNKIQYLNDEDTRNVIVLATKDSFDKASIQEPPPLPKEED